MKKLLIFLLCVLCSSINATKYVNNQDYPFPMKISPKQLGLKGNLTNFELNQAKSLGKIKFGDPVRDHLRYKEVFKYENGILIQYVKQEYTFETDNEITKWTFRYNEKKQLIEVTELFYRHGDKDETDVSKSRYIYTYTNDKLVKVEHKYDNNNHIRNVWRISYKGNQEIIDEYDRNGSLWQQYVYTNGKLTSELLFYNEEISSITKNEYDKLGRLVKTYRKNDYGESTEVIKYNQSGLDASYSYQFDKDGNWTIKCGKPDTPNGAFWIFDRNIEK